LFYVSGRLNQLSGLILGSFDYSADENNNLKLEREVWNRVLELTANTDYPVWSKFPIGHLDRNHTIPIGVTATMNSSNAELIIEANVDNNH
jgi:muramoyltetrapeptide carboxypeptidase LdcA involved in peptidoglycan recycling